MWGVHSGTVPASLLPAPDIARRHHVFLVDELRFMCPFDNPGFALRGARNRYLHQTRAWLPALVFEATSLKGDRFASGGSTTP